MTVKVRSLAAKHDAFPFQQEAVNAVKGLEFAAIFHEQGLGKTKIAIDLALYWLANKEIEVALIVTKKGLVNNWKKEIRSHTHILPVILSEPSSRSLRVIRSSVPIFITHYELLKTDPQLIQMLQKRKSVAAILDEAQKIKNPESDLTKSVLSLSSGFTKRLILTGTPIANRPYDIWSQIFFLDGGSSLGKNFKDFRKEHDIPKISSNYNELEADEEPSDSQEIQVFETNLNELFGKIEDFSIRETKINSGIALPHKIYSTIECQWSPQQRDIYEKIKDEVAITVVRGGKETSDLSDALLKKLLRLLQVASNPLVIDEKYEEIPGKYFSLEKELERIFAAGEKAIVWSNFTGNVDWLTKKLNAYGAVKIHGKLSMERRNNAVESFLNREATKVLIATPAAAKEGLTLTVANHVIFYDRSFSLDDYLQAQDRIHRISQERTCYVYNLVMPDSIDEWVESLIGIKSAAAALAQQDISLEEYRSIARYDLSELLQHILGDE